MQRSRDEIDFGSSGRKLEKEREKRMAELRKRKEKERALAAAAKKEQEKLEQITAQRRAQEAAALEATRLAALEEERQTGGISFSAVLKPVPTMRDGERILLPPSALAALTSSGALDANTPMAFQITAVHQGAVVGTTHAGVAEFIAEEGTVGLPPKTALSLTKERGVASIGDFQELRVKYIKLTHSGRAFVRLQPRGEGFHRQGQDVVNMDIKAVLERELASHTAITTGDWLPIRHERQGYELVVVDLEPAGVGGALSLINTDLEVDLMPSEATVQEQERLQRIEEEKQRQQELAEAKAAARRERAAALAGSMPPEPPADQAKDVVSVLVRLPTGGQVSRRFRRDDPLDTVFNFVESDAAVTVGVDRGEYTLGMNYPKRTFTATDAQLSLSEAGLTGRREALFLQTLAGEPDHEEDPAMEVETPSGGTAEPMRSLAAGGIWTSAAEAHVSKLDRQLSEEQHQVLEEAVDTPSEDPRPTGQALVDMFHHLTSLGVERQTAATAAQKYGRQLQELAAMGFSDVHGNIELLDR